MFRQTRQTDNSLTEGQRSLRWLRLVGVVVVAFALGLLMQAAFALATPTAAKASSAIQSSIRDDGGGDNGGDVGGDVTTTHGIINHRPAERNNTWVISGTEYTVNSDTILQGELHEGDCVEVQVKSDAPHVAIKIAEADASDCVGDNNGGGDNGGDGNGGGETGDFTETHGILNDRPQERNGTWVISDTEYTVNADTILEGELQQGACVDVKVKSDAPTVAVKIEQVEASNCSSGDNGGGDNGGNQGDVTTTVGILTQRQQKAGIWIVDGKPFTVTMDTIIEEQHGGLPVGACVQVTALVSDPTTAIKIESEDKSECNDDNGGDNGGSNGGGDNHGGDHEGEHPGLGRTVNFGVVNSMPAGEEGTWDIGGKVYTSTKETEVDDSHGALDVGVCAKVVVLKSDPTDALEIRSMPAYLCKRGKDDLAKGTLFGIVQQLPDDLHNGIWKIGGLSFVVSTTTDLIDHGLVFTPGVTVRVDFVTNISDTNFAKSIEIKFGEGNPCSEDSHNASAAGVNHEGDDHEHDFGRCPGLQGQAVGAIEKLPDGGLLGNWTIGGVPYLTDAFTKFGPGDYAVGDQVKVEYVVISPTLRFATKIKKVEGAGHGPNESILVGTVISKPVAFVGDWNIDGAPFVAVSDTVFVEHGSLLAVGSFVVVHYHITNDQRIIDKIVAAIPPGAGDENNSGKIESISPSVSAASTNASPSSDQVWTIGGVQYIVSDATMVADSGTDLKAGDTVSVNSYVDNGQRFATLIREQSNAMFLPMTINK